MPLQAMWVHGNSVVPEKTVKAEPFGTDGPLTDIPGVPGSGMLGLRQGSGTTFRGKDNHSNWFHFYIPTPCYRDGSRAKLGKVFVLFNSDSSVSVTDVHVWDGATRIYTSAMPSGVSGRHDGTGGLADLQDNITAWALIDNPEILFGVIICVNVNFSDEGNIRFVSAGADFLV